MRNYATTIFCPYCGTISKTVQATQLVPGGSVLFRCPKCDTLFKIELSYRMIESVNNDKCLAVKEEAQKESDWWQLR